MEGVPKENETCATKPPRGAISPSQPLPTCEPVKTNRKGGKKRGGWPPTATPRKEATRKKKMGVPPAWVSYYVVTPFNG